MRKAPSTRVMEIFSEAALSPAARRAAYLERACGGDTELRAEVESLLATQEQASNFLDAPTVEGEDGEAGGGGADPPDEAFIEREPARVGRYSIVQRIGEGGFGVVYRATQVHPIRREVALKIVKLGMDTGRVIARFESERQALARMDHPNIARIFDAGATADGRPYFAMELVDGPPITAYCDANRLTIPQRLGLFVQVCLAVQHAHQKGIIHRDLKPSNILVAQVDGAAVPKVIDFGIAKAMESGGAGQTAFTELRHFIGTPQYMSPEQAGAADGAGGGDVDTRSDIYSLGVLLYELLTGVTPFDAERMSRASFDQVHRIVCEERPPRPSARVSATGAAAEVAAGLRGLDGPRLRRALARELDWVVVKAMEKDRARRYDTAGALADDVRRYLAREPVLAGPPDTLYRLRLFARRHRGALLAAASVAAALMLGLAGTTFGLVRAKRDRVRTEAALAEAEQVSRFLADMLRSANPDLARGNQVLVRDVLDHTSRSLDEGALKERPLVEAGIRLTLGHSYQSLGLLSQSESHFRRALEIRERALGTNNRETARAMFALGGAMGETGDKVASESFIRRALAIQEGLLGAGHPECLDMRCSLAWAMWSNGNVAGAQAELRSIIERSRSGPAASPARLASALGKLGAILLDTHDYGGAEPLLTEALALDQAAHGDKHRTVPRNMSNLAAVRMGRGDFKGAEAYWLEALQLQRQILPADHQDIAWTLRLLGKARAGQGDLAGAEQYIRDGLAMERRVFRREHHPIYAFFLEDLIFVLHKAGRGEEAARALDEWFELRLGEKSELAAAHPDSYPLRQDVVTLCLRHASFERARRELDTLLKLAPDRAGWWLTAGLLRAYLGDDADYRRLRRQLLGRFGDTVDANDACQIAFTSVMAPLDDGQAATVERLAVLGASIESAKPGRQLVLGVALFRARHFEAALEPLARCVASAPGPALRGAAGYFRSLALRELGRDAEAEAAAAAARAESAKLAQPGAGEIGGETDDWLVCHLAAREAEAARR